MQENDLEKFKDQKLPLARIKKIMKSDEDVRMISAEAPILFAKACEMFIIEMTHKAYYYAKKNNRKTLQRNDIAAAITDTEIYDFLLDIMPRDEIINNAKDKQISPYQRQLLDDAWNIQQLQQTQLAAPQSIQAAQYQQQALPIASLSTQSTSNTSGVKLEQVRQQHQQLMRDQEEGAEEDLPGEADEMEEEKQQPANAAHFDKDEDSNEQDQKLQLQKQKSISADVTSPPLTRNKSSIKQQQPDEDQDGDDGSDQKRRSQRGTTKKPSK
eukprot:403337928